jgi:NADH-quinone oxidoreductase subunit J
MIGQSISFWILAVVAVVAALMVVSLQNVFRSALALVLCFLVIAGIYILLSAEFLAVVQILIYVGAISVVIILAIMMTREFQHGSPSNRLRIPALVISLVFLGIILFAVANTTWNISGTAPAAATSNVLADRLFGSGGYILPVEIAGLLLLAAVIGSIVLVRNKK